MENFNIIPNTGTYGSAIALINANFSLTKEQLERLSYSREGFCGMYETDDDLEAAYPHPTTGSFAYVGTSFPMDVYTATNGVWAKTIEDGYSGGGIDLTQYADKASLDALAGRVTALENAGYVFIGIATPAGAPSPSQAKRFALAWAAGTYTYYGGFVLNSGEMAVLMYNGSAWSGTKTDIIAKGVVGGYDTTPTEDSEKPITSGGVYTAMDELRSDMEDELSNVDMEFGSGEYVSDVIIHNSVGQNESVLLTQGGITSFVFNEIDINDIDNLKNIDYAYSPSQSQSKKTSYYTVVTFRGTSATQKVKVGTMVVISDGLARMVTEVMTTRYILDASGNLTGEFSNNDVFTIYRSTSDNTWTQWHYVNESVWSGAINAIRTDLTNYYTKSQTYSRTEVDNLIAAINQFEYIVVNSLPYPPSANTMRKIYLIPSAHSVTQNVKDEYITIQDGNSYKWEQIGSTAVDLSGYSTTAEMNTAINAAIASALISYYTKTEVNTLLDGKQNVIDDLATIRSGAAAGATAVQPAAIADFATTNYVDDAIAAIPVDDEPTAGSENLAKSGGIRMAMNPDIEMESGYYLSSSGEPTQTSSEHFAVTDYYFVMDGIKVVNYHGASASAYTYLCFYDLDKKFISRLYSSGEAVGTYTMTSSAIPSDAVYFRVSIDPTITGTRIEVPQNNIAYPIMGVVNGLLTGLEITAGYYLNTKGETVSTGTSNFNVTDFMFATEGLRLVNCHPTSSAGKTYAVFYDSSKSAVGLLTASNTDRTTKVLQASDIPAGAVYIRATLYNDGRIENRKNYATVKTTEVVADTLSSYSTVSVGRTEMCFLTATGDVKSTSLTTFNVTDFCPIQEGIKVYKCHPASSAGKTFLCYYDANYDFISAVTDTHTTVDEYELTSSAIPEGAEYFRATVYADGYVDYLIPVSQLVKTVSNKAQTGSLSYFDYATALTMDKKELVCMIESASNGRVTALYDDEGYPSLMYKIPKVSVGAFSTALGNISTVHPAFIVDGVEKNYIYMSVFMTSVYNGHYVSWFGLKPKGQVTIPDLRTKISSKGEGWHLETIYERSLLALLTMKMNSSTPTGNTKKGMSHVNFWEYCQMTDGILPGLGLPGGRTGIEWFNGTQPAAWSHNKELWGIQDVIGGYHEICDLMKLVNGKIYLASDNKYFSVNDDIETFESDWVDTGAAYDVVDNNLALSTQVVNPTPADTYLLKSYQNILCTSAYDSLSENIRKKMCLLLLSPRLDSSSNAIFPIAGRFGINNVKDLCYGVFGGAEEYEESGLGALIAGYPIDNNNEEGHNAHYNMGSRIVYIG